MAEMLRVLQVEDSAGDASLIERMLTKSGYAVYCERVVDAYEMRAALAKQTWDLIIADYRLPAFDAPSALALLHETGQDIPFIVVSGAMGEDLAGGRERRRPRPRRQREQAERALGESEQQLERQTTLLLQRETMLREIHHRVKNNMQVMSSLLSLQSRVTSDPAARRMLEDNQNRIQSMALLHEILYQSDNLAVVDFSKYVRRMVEYLFRSYGVDNRQIRLHTELDPVSLDLDDALPCALLISEVISNSLKHGFPEGRGGEISILLRGESGTTVSLVVSDDGVGLPGNL